RLRGGDYSRRLSGAAAYSVHPARFVPIEAHGGRPLRRRLMRRRVPLHCQAFAARDGSVGRTPRSAAGPLAGLFSCRRRADGGVGRGPGGPPHNSGQATVEFAVLYAAVVLPLTFMIVFVSEMLWIWHSVADFTRDGARYAATH